MSGPVSGRPAPPLLRGDDAERARARALVTGRVQGVCYRAETQREAQARGVTGWVRNLADGSVEVLAEGPREAVEGLLAWCRRGPSYARVEEVEVSWHPPTGEFTRFTVTSEKGAR